MGRMFLEWFPLIIGLALAVGGYAGWAMARDAFSGDWGWRWTHKCGWFAQYTFNHYPNHPCPRCGGIGKTEWKRRLGRPKWPFGWEWKETPAPGTDLR